MRDCDVKCEILRQHINTMKHQLVLAIADKSSQEHLRKLYDEQLKKHQELELLGQRKMKLAQKAYDF